MITCSLEGVIHTFKQHMRLVFNGACFSMPYQLSINYLASESIDYALMAKANSKDGYRGSKICYYVSTNSEIFTIRGVTWSWRYNYCVRIHSFNIFQPYFVISNDSWLSFKLT